MPEFFQRILKKEKIFFLIVLLGISFVLIFDVDTNKAFSSSYAFMIFVLLITNFLIFSASTSDEVPDKGQGVSYLMFFRILMSIILFVIYLKGAFKFQGSILATGMLYFTLLLLVVSIVLDFVGAMKLLKHKGIGKVIAITMSIIMFYVLLMNFLTLIPEVSEKNEAKKLLGHKARLGGVHSAEYKARYGRFVNIVKGIEKNYERVKAPEATKGENAIIDINKIKDSLVPYKIPNDAKPLFWRKVETRQIGMISINAPTPSPVELSYGLLGDSPDLNKIKTLFPAGTLIPN